MGLANERQHYNVTSSLIGSAHNHAKLSLFSNDADGHFGIVKLLLIGSSSKGYFDLKKKNLNPF